MVSAISFFREKYTQGASDQTLQWSEPDLGLLHKTEYGRAGVLNGDGGNHYGRDDCE